jgi:ABC-type thiamin/hydroxymethylpyrimidine transport system permease subunit
VRILNETALVAGNGSAAGTVITRHARSPWIVAMLTGLTAPIAFAFSYRMLPAASRRTA